MDFTPIYSKKLNKVIFQKHDTNEIYNYDAPLIFSNNQRDVSTGTEFESEKLRVCCHNAGGQINLMSFDE